MSERTSTKVKISLISIFILVYIIFGGVKGILYYSLLLICVLSLGISVIVCIKNRGDKKILITELIADGIIVILMVIFIIKLVTMK